MPKNPFKPADINDALLIGRELGLGLATIAQLGKGWTIEFRDGDRLSRSHSKGVSAPALKGWLAGAKAALSIANAKLQQAEAARETAVPEAIEDLTDGELIKALQRRDADADDLTRAFWDRMAPDVDQVKAIAQDHELRVLDDDELDAEIAEAVEDGIKAHIVTRLAAEAAHARNGADRDHRLGELRFALERECSISAAHQARLM